MDKDRMAWMENQDGGWRDAGNGGEAEARQPRPFGALSAHSHGSCDLYRPVPVGRDGCTCTVHLQQNLTSSLLLSILFLVTSRSPSPCMVAIPLPRIRLQVRVRALVNWPLIQLHTFTPSSSAPCLFLDPRSFAHPHFYPAPRPDKTTPVRPRCSLPKWIQQ